MVCVVEYELENWLGLGSQVLHDLADLMGKIEKVELSLEVYCEN